MVFSAFDQFRPVANDEVTGSVKYSYIGLKKVLAAPGGTSGSPESAVQVAMKGKEETRSL